MINYYRILDIKVRFAINYEEMRANYLKLQSQKTDHKETGDAMLLNEAYKNLMNDFLRAKHMLGLRGIDFEKVSANAIEASELEKIWKQREEVDNINNISELEKLFVFYGEEKNILIRELDSIFLQENNQLALALTIKLRYLDNLIENIKIKIRGIKNADRGD